MPFVCVYQWCLNLKVLGIVLIIYLFFISSQKMSMLCEAGGGGATRAVTETPGVGSLNISLPVQDMQLVQGTFGDFLTCATEMEEVGFVMTYSCLSLQNHHKAKTVLYDSKYFPW